MSDFFISYNSADRAWAEWIGFVLEEQGFSVIIQAWDFRPGANFVLEMHTAATTAERTIMILSPDYLRSQFTAPEWAAAFAHDPKGLSRKLIPLMVRKCEPSGLLASIVHINIENSAETEAERLLLDGIKGGRSKPSHRPAFPGREERRSRRAFPGLKQSSTGESASPYMPKVTLRPTDAEKRRFVRSAFDVIKGYFELALKALAEREAAIDCDFQDNAALDFVAEIFLSGASKCRCRIRYGGMLGGDGITFSEGRSHFGDNSFNEMLSISEDGHGLYLSSLMGDMFGGSETNLDLKKMSQQQAAEYLWRRFVRGLER